MSRTYHSAIVEEFLRADNNLILGNLTKCHQFDLVDLQTNAWLAQIDILQDCLSRLTGSYIAFEYAIPRMGKMS